MRFFIRIWMGQLVSTIGSYMTVFALMIWVWQQTESATTLALVSFFSQLPRIFITPIAGMIVDRFDRKRLMILGDVAALLATLAIALLYFTDVLHIWHLYGTVAIYGCFGQIQNLAYSTSIAILVPKAQYTRAESMVAAVNYSGAIFSPILAGSLYPILGLSGIFVIDLTTFFLAFGTLLTVTIPKPALPELNSRSDRTPPPASLSQKLTYGFRYIAARPGLIAMVVAFSLFAMPNDMSKALYNPMILARSGGDAQVLGVVTTAAGIGGVLGAIGVSAWGGFHKKIHGMLVGFAIAGFFKIILGIGQSSWIWIAAHFCSTLAVPLFYSSSNAIWYSKVPPSAQGRVLAADQMIGLMIGAIAPLIVGPLADHVFEPAMTEGGWLMPIFGPIIGTGSGSGIALLYAMMALLMMLVGIGGYSIHTLRNVESILPDHDEKSTALTH